MKRGKALLKKILEDIGENQDPSQMATAVVIDGYDDKAVAFPIRLLNEGKEIEAVVQRMFDGGGLTGEIRYWISRVTEIVSQSASRASSFS